MRYTETEIPQEINGPVDFIKFVVSFFICAPFRIVCTISKKLIFLDEHLLKLLLVQTIMITCLIVSSTIWNLLISKNLQIFSGLLPLTSLLIALGLTIFLYFFLQYFQYHFDFKQLDKHVKDIEESLAAHEVVDEEYVDRDGTIIDEPETFQGEKVPTSENSSYKSPKIDISRFGTLAEGLQSGEISFTDDVELNRTINATPKIDRDPVYSLERSASDKIKIDLLKQKCSGSDLEQERRLFEAFSHDSDEVLTMQERFGFTGDTDVDVFNTNINLPDSVGKLTDSDDEFTFFDDDDD